MRLTLATHPRLSLAWPAHDSYTRPKPHGPSKGAGTTPVVLTIQEACTALRVSKWTVYQLIRSRRLATIKLGRRRVVPIAAVHALIDRLRNEEEA